LASVVAVAVAVVVVVVVVVVGGMAATIWRCWAR
jgi:Na+(H+)/acetate symporter ActP